MAQFYDEVKSLKERLSYCIGNLTQTEIDALDTSVFRKGDWVVNIDYPKIQIWDGAGWETKFDDLRFPVSDLKPGLTNPPDFVAFKGGTFCLAFSQSQDEDVHFMVQLPHGWKEGSTIHPHIHWSSKSGTAGNVAWALEYTVANPNGTFGDTTTDVITAPNPSAYKHGIDGFSSIDMTGYTLSCILICKLYRDVSDVGDTLAEDAHLLEIDFHYEIDSDGSRQEYIK